MNFEHVLVLGAHPDDEVACAGTLARLREQGSRVALITFSECADLNNRDVLSAEWESIVESLGGYGALLDLPNRDLPRYREDILERLDAEIRIHSGDPYDLVLVPARSDTHQDHATVTAEAIRVFKRTTMLGYEHCQNTVGSAVWNALVALEPQHVEDKITHARAYRSQALKPYMQEAYLRGVLALHGVQAGVDAAEAFEVIRWIQ